jgi:predicted nucleic acid-binding protein
MVRGAIGIGERYGLSHWDALIVSAAQCRQLSANALKSLKYQPIFPAGASS